MGIGNGDGEWRASGRGAAETGGLDLNNGIAVIHFEHLGLGKNSRFDHFGQVSVARAAQAIAVKAA